ncbi:MAG: hypothetical protein H5T73_07600 [Actinobacteria bacterium]|nr:hypothetical protein [Actinomycetota bacterium]
MAKRYDSGKGIFEKYEGPGPAGGKKVWVKNKRDGKWGKGVGRTTEEAEERAKDDLWRKK